MFRFSTCFSVRRDPRRSGSGWCASSLANVFPQRQKGGFSGSAWAGLLALTGRSAGGFRWLRNARRGPLSSDWLRRGSWGRLAFQPANPLLGQAALDVGRALLCLGREGIGPARPCSTLWSLTGPRGPGLPGGRRWPPRDLYRAGFKPRSQGGRGHHAARTGLVTGFGHPLPPSFFFFSGLARSAS